MNQEQDKGGAVLTPFGTTDRGQNVTRITLAAGDLRVDLLTWGAVVQSVRLAGVDHDLTLGSDRLADYQGDMRHHGSLIGPVVNRIGNARVRLGGMMHELERNQDGRISLHSGRNGTHLQVWDLVAASADSATLRITLPDGMCELPGNRVVTAVFTVSAPATLTLEITGTTDDTTIMNFANHCYWNLDGSACWEGNSLRIAADHVLPTDEDFVPTGEVLPVADTPLDFRDGAVPHPADPPLDNNFCLSEDSQPLRDVLWLAGARGVSMTVATTEPGIQVYDGRYAARPGRENYEGLAIEAQRWPDATNNRQFPSIRLEPGETYHQTTQWRFEKRKP